MAPEVIQESRYDGKVRASSCMYAATKKKVARTQRTLQRTAVPPNLLCDVIEETELCRCKHSFAPA